MKFKVSEELKPYLFILPLAALIFIFVFSPIIGTFWTSFSRDIIFLKRKFILFENYRELLADAGFWQSLRFTILFICVSVPLELMLGVLFAVLLNQNIPMRGLLRASVLIPWAIPSVISGRIWELIYNYNYGLANCVITGLGFSDAPINFLGTNLAAFAAIVLADVWKTVPFVAIIVLAGLQAIPQDLYSQAKIDRANFIQAFFKITVPLLKPVLVVSLLFRTIDSLRVFDVIYVLTGGGPGGATTSLSLYAYKYFLGGDFGYGSAVSIALFIVSLSLSVFYVKCSKFAESL
ncbi:MAG: sugar ABC transporter permease [Elusimicrobia bacterium]|nr:sugar ABC transporter permease [Elusimicrobiota bacterium]